VAASDSAYADLVPTNVASELITAAVESSVALTLGRRIVAPPGTTKVPIAASQPVAGWVSADGRKPTSDVKFATEHLVPEEAAILLPIPDDFIADSSFPIWASIRPMVAAAIGRVVDLAILTGDQAPASFPPGGIEAIAGPPVTGPDPARAISAAMGDVEASGVPVTGIAAGVGIGATLRDVQLEFGVGGGIPDATGQSIFGVPVRVTSALDPAVALVGDWSALLVAVRSDIAYSLSDQATLTDGDGRVILSAYESDVSILRAYIRVGAAIGRPANMQNQATVPFKLVDFGGATGAAARQKASKG
jgi:hypothetical protein